MAKTVSFFLHQLCLSSRKIGYEKQLFFITLLIVIDRISLYFFQLWSVISKAVIGAVGDKVICYLVVSVPLPAGV